jgi:hypothetical protein
MSHVGVLAPSGELSLRVFRAWPMEPKLRDVARHGLPRHGLDRGVAMWRLRTCRTYGEAYGA